MAHLRSRTLFPEHLQFWKSLSGFQPHPFHMFHRPWNAHCAVTLAPCHCPESSLQHPSQGLRYSPPAQLSTRKHSDVINAQKWWPVDLLCGGGKKIEFPKKSSSQPIHYTQSLSMTILLHTPWILQAVPVLRLVPVGSSYIITIHQSVRVVRPRLGTPREGHGGHWWSPTVPSEAPSPPLPTLGLRPVDVTSCWLVKKTLVTELKRFCQVPSSSRGLESLVVMKWGAISTSPYDMFRWL